MCDWTACGVTDWDDHCVSVFTTDGKHVTSFGQFGENEGDFNHPKGINMCGQSWFSLCL